MNNKKTYNQIRHELDATLDKLQAEDIDVDESIKLYEKGKELVKELGAYLNNAEIKIKQIKTKYKL